MSYFDKLPIEVVSYICFFQTADDFARLLMTCKDFFRGAYFHGSDNEQETSLVRYHWKRYLSIRWGMNSKELRINRGINLQSLYPAALPILDGLQLKMSASGLECLGNSAYFTGVVGEGNRSIAAVLPFAAISSPDKPSSPFDRLMEYVKECLSQGLSREMMINLPESASKLLQQNIDQFRVSMGSPHQLHNNRRKGPHFSTPFLSYAESEATNDGPSSYVFPRAVSYYEVAIVRHKSHSLSSDHRTRRVEPVLHRRVDTVASLTNRLDLPTAGNVDDYEEDVAREGGTGTHNNNNNSNNSNRRRRHTLADDIDNNNDNDGAVVAGDGRSECIAVGLSTRQFPSDRRLPGWDRESFGYHSDDGGVYHGTGRRLSVFGPTFGCGDVVGCGIDYVTRSIFYTINGQFLGEAFHDVVSGVELFPTVGIDAHVKVVFNFGKEPFRFDLVAYINRNNIINDSYNNRIAKNSNPLLELWQNPRFDLPRRATF